METKTSEFSEIDDSETWKTVGNNCPTTEEHPQKETLTDLTYGTASVIYDHPLHAITKLKGFK